MRKGFTLIELIIYIGLTSLIVVVLLKVMLTVLGTQEKTKTVSTVQQEIRFTMDRMTYSTLNAVSVNTGSSIFGSSGGTLSLAMSGSSINPTVFFLSGNRVYVTEGVGSAVALTSQNILVYELQFQNLTATGANATVKIEMHAKDAVTESGRDREDEMSLSTSVTLRQ